MWSDTMGRRAPSMQLGYALCTMRKLMGRYWIWAVKARMIR